ncbi:secreted phosphoprotein 24 isoform X3 [Heliangelus exortis]|uniref:secreted phosphoprotein 24 isoform X3 n=1 Tax=Heliangelus exortis TaxID=472823 RepID=UPI003A95BAAD
MRILIFVLVLGVFSCLGFPVYDYELPVTEEALNVSIARINSQSWGTNLYGVVRSRVTRVEMWNSGDYRLELQFSIRETVCTKASGRDPFTCDFKIGPFVMMHMPVMSPSRQGSSPREDLFAPEALPSRRGSRHEDWHRSSYFSSAKTE